MISIKHWNLNLIYITGSCCLVIGMLLWTSCKKQPEKVHATIEKITGSVYASGNIKSKNQYQAFSTVSGLVQKVWVKEGDLVKKGDPLFTIKNESSQLNAENAQIAANFALKNTSGDRLAELKGIIETSRSKMLNDLVLLTRQRTLWAQQIGAKVELEQRELALENSRNNYQAAHLRYTELKRQLDFAAAQAQKQLSISQTVAQDFTIRAQMDGRVYSIAKELGEIVNPQTPVAVIGNADDFVAELQVDENDIVRLRHGQRVLFTLDSYKGEVFEGTVDQIDPIMNERSRTFTITAVFTQKPPVLYPNLTTEANIVILSKEKALTIPRAFLVQDSIVMLENKEKRVVKTGLKDYQKVEILSGLTESDIIIDPRK